MAVEAPVRHVRNARHVRYGTIGAPAGKCSIRYLVSSVYTCSVVPSPSQMQCERLGYAMKSTCFPSSTSRLKRVLAFMEERQIIVVRVDLGGRRAITLPHFGWSTRPGEPADDVPERRYRRG